MNGQDLKLFAKCYINVSENSLADKKALYTFVEQASEDQVWYLLMHGQMAKESYLNEIDWVQTTKFLSKIKFPGEEWFRDYSMKASVKGVSKGATKYYETHSSLDPLIRYINTLQAGNKAGELALTKTYTLLKGGAILGATAVAAMILWMAVKAVRGDFGKFKQCMKLPKESQKGCKEAVQKMIWQKELKTMLGAKKFCQKSKDPSKCTAKVDKKIASIRSKMSK
jgi:hypothetical protein